MKIPKSVNLVFKSALLATAVAFSVFNLRAATVTWTGLSTVTNGWSDTNNWSPTQLPTASDITLFGNASGYTNLLGAVNNVVDSNITVSNLIYSVISNSVSANFHTTLINTGMTLTAGSTISTTNATAILVATDNGGANDQTYATITGGGTLAIGNLASPDTNKDLVVSTRALTANSGAHKATLDLSGLNRFTFGGGRFQVAANGISAALGGQSTFTGVDRAWGSVLLAKTNVITAARPKTDPIVSAPSAFPFAPSPFSAGVDRYGNASANLVLIELGQENTINTAAITLGGARHAQGATMRFRAGLTNPTLKLRSADGISRIAELAIGDNDVPVGGTVACVGTLDLSLGSVDALVDNMIIGRNQAILNAQSGANGTGTLTLGAGTWDVITLNIGCQSANNFNRATGTVTVRTNATLIAGSINIGRDAGDNATGFGTGTLTLLGGSARVSGNILENDAPGGLNGTSTLTLNNGATLDMMPPGDTVPGDITVDRLNFGICTLTNYSTLGLSTLAITAPATELTVYPGQTLAPVAKGLVGTLAVSGGNLTLTNATLHFDLDSPGVNDLINIPSGTLTLLGLNSVNLSATNSTFAAGTYTLITYGALVGETNNLQLTGPLVTSRYSLALDTNSFPNLNLIVGGAIANLTWSGDGAGNVWNLKTATNWNNQTDGFYDLDTVTFDDTSTNQGVILSGTLQPASVTVNGAKNYTFGGTGKISGTTGLLDNDSGTLTISTTNEYIGDTTINAGTLLVNGGLGLSTVNVNSSATLGGTGTILGPVTVQSGGNFAPGASIGTLAISNNLVLAGGSTSVFEANLDTLTCDKVTGLTKVTYGGTLTMSLSGRAVVGTDTFKLFSAATYAGSFSSITPATPGAGLDWRTNTLATDGTLRVVSTVPANVTVQVSGNQITLSWPADHVGWRLQSQTNSINVGLSTNWVTVPGSTATSSITQTINPANGAVFYRLIYP